MHTAGEGLGHRELGRSGAQAVEGSGEREQLMQYLIDEMGAPKKDTRMVHVAAHKKANVDESWEQLVLRKGNAFADKFAKEGRKLHEVPKSAKNEAKRLYKVVKENAKWAGKLAARMREGVPDFTERKERKTQPKHQAPVKVKGKKSRKTSLMSRLWWNKLVEKGRNGSDEEELGTPPVREEPPFTHPAVRGDLDDTD